MLPLLLLLPLYPMTVMRLVRRVVTIAFIELKRCTV